MTETSDLPVSLCAFTPGCEATCAVGIPDGPSGCCGLDGVEFAVSCSADDGDDSTAVNFLVASGLEECVPVTFEYEF